MVFKHEIRNIVLFAIVSLPIIVKDSFNYKMQPALQLDNTLASIIILYMPDFHFHFWYILLDDAMHHNIPAGETGCC